MGKPNNKYTQKPVAKWLLTHFSQDEINRILISKINKSRAYNFKLSRIVNYLYTLNPQINLDPFLTMIQSYNLTRLQPDLDLEKCLKMYCGHKKCYFNLKNNYDNFHAIKNIFKNVKKKENKHDVSCIYQESELYNNFSITIQDKNKNFAKLEIVGNEHNFSLLISSTNNEFRRVPVFQLKNNIENYLFLLLVLYGQNSNLYNKIKVLLEYKIDISKLKHIFLYSEPNYPNELNLSSNSPLPLIQEENDRIMQNVSALLKDFNFGDILFLFDHLDSWQSQEIDLLLSLKVIEDKQKRLNYIKIWKFLCDKSICSQYRETALKGFKLILLDYKKLTLPKEKELIKNSVDIDQLTQNTKQILEEYKEIYIILYNTFYNKHYEDLKSDIEYLLFSHFNIIDIEELDQKFDLSHFFFSLNPKSLTPLLIDNLKYTNPNYCEKLLKEYILKYEIDLYDWIIGEHQNHSEIFTQEVFGYNPKHAIGLSNNEFVKNKMVGFLLKKMCETIFNPSYQGNYNLSTIKNFISHILFFNTHCSAYWLHDHIFSQYNQLGLENFLDNYIKYRYLAQEVAIMNNTPLIDYQEHGFAISSNLVTHERQTLYIQFVYLNDLIYPIISSQLAKNEVLHQAVLNKTFTKESFLLFIKHYQHISHYLKVDDVRNEQELYISMSNGLESAQKKISILESL